MHTTAKVRRSKREVSKLLLQKIWPPAKKGSKCAEWPDPGPSAGATGEHSMPHLVSTTGAGTVADAAFCFARSDRICDKKLPHGYGRCLWIRNEVWETQHVHVGEDGGFSELLGECVDWDASSWMQSVPRVATLAKNLHV